MQRQNFNLACLHKECELNYSRIVRLVGVHPDMGSSFTVPNSQSKIQFEIIDSTKFTITLAIKIIADTPQWLPSIEMKVRIYSDARMAEVIEWCSDNCIPWALVERKGLQSRDEKWQWNIFLGEVLYQALHHKRIAKVKSS